MIIVDDGEQFTHANFRVGNIFHKECEVKTLLWRTSFPTLFAGLKHPNSTEVLLIVELAFYWLAKKKKCLQSTLSHHLPSGMF